MRKAALLLLSAALVLPAAAEAKNREQNEYTAGKSIMFQPKGLVRNFSATIPSGTKVLYSDGVNETSYSLTYGKASMRIRAIYTKNPDLLLQIQEKKWELRDMDPSIRIIIDGQNITIRKSVKGTLLVYQYKDSGKKAVIQRTLITSQGSFIYIIDCSAPVKSFYKYEESFNILMGGFRITDNEIPFHEKNISPDHEKNEQSAKPSHKPDINADVNEFDSMGLKEDAQGETKTDVTPLKPEAK